MMEIQDKERDEKMKKIQIIAIVAMVAVIALILYSTELLFKKSSTEQNQNPPQTTMAVANTTGDQVALNSGQSSAADANNTAQNQTNVNSTDNPTQNQTSTNEQNKDNPVQPESVEGNNVVLNGDAKQPQQKITPIFLYFVSTKDANYADTMKIIDELKEQYKGKIVFDIRDIDSDPEATKNFPVEGATPALIMQNSSNEICAFEMMCSDKAKMIEIIEKTLQ